MLRQSQQSSSVPGELLSRLAAIYPPDIARTIERTFVERPTSFRCNTLRSPVEKVLETLKREGITVRRLNWCREGFLLTNSSQRALQKLDLFKDGKIYLQSLASMVPVLVMAPRPGEKVLDMTAAPGSKTSQIAALMERKGSLHACELDQIRFQRLAHNMRLLGVEETERFLTLHRGDANEIFSGAEHAESFDRILLDAPCSAESRIVSKDRRSHSFWGEQTIRRRAAEQRRLLESAWRLLRPGGTLVYSTCTFAPEENEVQLSEFLSVQRDAALAAIPPLSGVKALPGLQRWNGAALNPQLRNALRIVPNAEIEGFFVARVSKR